MLLSAEEAQLARIQTSMTSDSRSAAIAAISNEIANLTELLDVREWSDDTDRAEIPMEFHTTFARWLASSYCEFMREYAFDEHRSLAGDAPVPEPGTPEYLRQEAEWLVARAEWIDKRRPAEEDLNAISGACAYLAQQHEIPFDKDLALATARSFMDTYPSWNESTC